MACVREITLPDDLVCEDFMTTPRGRADDRPPLRARISSFVWEGWTMKSPYLKDNRLGDVLAAVQVMALHPQYRLSCAKWADGICGDESKAEYWKVIFDEHPEFFRKSSSVADNYALIWRRALPRRYNRGTHDV